MGIASLFKKNLEQPLQEALIKLKGEEKKHQTDLDNYRQQLKGKEEALNLALIQINLEEAETLDMEIKDLKAAILKKEELLNLLQPSNSIAVKTAVENIFKEFHSEVLAAKVKGDKEEQKIRMRIEELLGLMSNCDDINIQFTQRANELKTHLKYLNKEDSQAILDLYFSYNSLKQEPYPRYRMKLYFERLQEEVKNKS